MFLQHRLRNPHFIFYSLSSQAQQQLIPFLLNLLPPRRIPPQKCHWTCPRQVQCLLRLLHQKQYNKPKYVAYKHHHQPHQKTIEISLDVYTYWWMLLWNNWKKSLLKKEGILHRSRKYPHCKLLSQHITLRLNNLNRLLLFIPNTNKFVFRKD